MIVSGRSTTRWLAMACLLCLGASTLGTQVLAKKRSHSARSQPIIVAKFGSTSTPTAFLGQVAVKFAQNVLKYSDGQIRIKVYQNGELGSSETTDSELQTNTVQFTANGTLDQYVPSIDLLSTGYLFPNNTIAQDIVNSKAVRTLIWSKLQSHGIVALGVLATGQTDLLSTKPIHTPADLNGLKVRTFTASVEVPEYKAVGADAVEIVYAEAYTALATNLIQVVQDPPNQMQPENWQDVAKYLTIVNQAEVPLPVMVSKQFWFSLDGTERAQIDQGMAATLKWAVANTAASNATALSSMESEGVHVIRPNVALFKKAFAAADSSINHTFPGLLKQLQTVVSKEAK
ncbi:MAG TPA: TRAP transporter substrate-binding protein [Candidatus Dormibacteraeota bacterium]|nr:TRAP transporter substrate-binding protein [Candidatus Dormibacteraeota bacterium]